MATNSDWRFRLALKTTDVNWFKEKDLDVVHSRYADKQFKLVNPGHILWSCLHWLHWWYHNTHHNDLANYKAHFSDFQRNKTQLSDGHSYSGYADVRPVYKGPEWIVDSLYQSTIVYRFMAFINFISTIRTLNLNSCMKSIWLISTCIYPNKVASIKLDLTILFLCA